MGLLNAIGELCTMPIRCANELIDDLTEQNYEEDKYLSWLTFGTSSIVKGMGKTIKKSMSKLD